MSDSIITKMEEKIQEKSNATQQSEHQEVSEQVISVLKGKRASLCKEVLIGLIRHEIDKKSTVN